MSKVLPNIVVALIICTLMYVIAGPIFDAIEQIHNVLANSMQ